MNQSVRVEFDTLRSLAFGGISGAYAIVGTPFAHPVRLLTLQNLTDQNIFISKDGVTDHKILPTGGQIVLDFASDQSMVAGMWSLAIGDAIYIRQGTVAPTIGAFYVSADYGKGE